MEMANVIVNNPCSQKWNSMTPNGEGRFCESCCKTVVDFTKMDAEAVVSYLSRQPGKTCGYFLPHQVEVKRPMLHQFLVNLYQNTQNGIQTRFLRNVSLAFIAFCMTLVGCNSPTNGKSQLPSDSSEKITGEIALPSDSFENDVPLNNDSSKMEKDNNIIGDTTPVYEKVTTKVEKVETNLIGEIVLEPQPLDSSKISN